MNIKIKEIHVWSAELLLPQEQEQEQFALLSVDERERALRFHFPIHRQRFIAARSTLRQLLSLYLDLKAEKIQFAYTEHKKPYLKTPAQSVLQFNLSHSADLAVYAFTLGHAIGIDIEKIRNEDKQSLAQHFFSPAENAQLLQLAAHDRITGFYHLWSRKEALIKAIGEGLSIPLNSFSTSINEASETVVYANKTWSLISLSIHPAYRAALATDQPIGSIQLRKWPMDSF